MKTKVKYVLVLDLLGKNANGRHPKSFNSIEEARECWQEEYRDRNKGDGYDEYWRKTPFRVQQTITIDLWES